MDINDYIKALSVLDIGNDREIVLHFDSKTTSLEELCNIVERISKALNRNVLAIPYDMCLNSLSVETLELWVDMVKMSLQKRKVSVHIMTIAEIKSNIKYLQGVLKEKESELENQKDDMVGRYYKSGDAIGIIIKKDQHGDGEYICNEVYFFNSESYGESFEHDNCATNSISELELISKEEFERCFDRRIRKLRRLFLPE